MKTNADHAHQSNHNRLAAGEVSSKNKQASDLERLHNQTEARQIGKLQALANSSPQVQRLQAIQAMADRYALQQQAIQQTVNKKGPIQRLTTWRNIEGLESWSAGMLLPQDGYHVSMKEYGGKGTSNMFSKFHITQEVGVKDVSYPHFFFKDDGNYKPADSTNHPQSKVYIEDDDLNTEPDTWNKLEVDSKRQADDFLDDTKAKNALAKEKGEWGGKTSFTMTGVFSKKAKAKPETRVPEFTHPTTNITGQKGRGKGKGKFEYTVTVTFANADHAFESWKAIAVGVPWVEANQIE